jgi:coenzyme F420-reducing hydrogenase delta subunit
MGIEPDRLQFSWISSAESTKFASVINEVTSAVKALGPRKHYIKTKPYEPINNKISMAK